MSNSTLSPESTGANVQLDLSGLSAAVSRLQISPDSGKQEIRLADGSVLTAEICSQKELSRIMANGGGAESCDMKNLEKICMEKLIEGNEDCLLAVCDDGKVIIIKKSLSAEQRVGGTRGNLQKVLAPAEASDVSRDKFIEAVTSVLERAQTDFKKTTFEFGLPDGRRVVAEAGEYRELSMDVPNVEFIPEVVDKLLRQGELQVCSMWYAPKPRNVKLSIKNPETK